MLSAFAENLVTISVKKEQLLNKSYVTGRRCPYSGVGEDFLARRPGSPHENGHNSETKSRTIDPCQNGTNAEGYERHFAKKTGSHTKKRIFGPKCGFLGPKKKSHF